MVKKCIYLSVSDREWIGLQPEALLYICGQCDDGIYFDNTKIET